jgi:hypothetical protein
MPANPVNLSVALITNCSAQLFRAPPVAGLSPDHLALRVWAGVWVSEELDKIFNYFNILGGRGVRLRKM